MSVANKKEPEKKQEYEKSDLWRRILSETWQTVACGFTVLMLTLGLLVAWAGLGSAVQGNILGFGFQLSALFFFLLTGLARSLKWVKLFSATVYRLFHFLLSAVFLFIAFFVIWQPLSVALGEQEANNLASGAVNYAYIVFAYVIFLGAYFAVIGIRAALFSSRQRREREAEEYRSMLKKNRQ